MLVKPLLSSAQGCAPQVWGSIAEQWETLKEKIWNGNGKAQMQDEA